MDSTYFGRTFCVMVFRDITNKANLFWKFLAYETIIEYQVGISKLIESGFSVKAIVCDGRRGIFQAFKNIPIQMCQFHQISIVIRYLTRRPKLQASIELLAIVRKLTETNELNFKEQLERWHHKWNIFLKERTINTDSGKWYYTHKRLRSAYLSLIHHMDFLFTYQKYESLNIPNTTNSLEGIFTDLKTHVRIHKGIQFENKQKLINEILKNRN